MKATNRSKKAKGKVLHIVYFVDSNETKTTSFNLFKLKIAFLLALSFSVLSVCAFATLLLLLRHNFIKGKELQELKAAHLAQSIVHENLLKEAPFLVAAKSGILLSKQSSQVADALMTATTVDFNTEELGFAESDPAENEAAPSPVVDTVSQASATAPKDLSTTETEKRMAASPQPTAPQNNVAAEQPLDKSTTQAEGQTKQITTRPVAFTQIKAIYSDSESRYLLKFSMQNLRPNAESLDGTLCAVLRGKSALGKTVSAHFPQSFQPEGLSKRPCAGGLRIRFARFRPSEMLIRSEQMNLDSVTFYLFAGDSYFKEEVKLN